MTACKKEICLQSVEQWLCSGVCLSPCRCVVLALLVYLSDVWLLGLAFCSPWVVAIRVRMFDLRSLGSGRSEGASRRTQIHLIWQTWQFRVGVFFYWLFRTGFVALRRRMMTQVLSYALVGSPPGIHMWLLSVWGTCPPIPVTILLGRSGFSNAVGSIESDASDDFQ